MAALRSLGRRPLIVMGVACAVGATGAACDQRAKTIRVGDVTGGQVPAEQAGLELRVSQHGRGARTEWGVATAAELGFALKIVKPEALSRLVDEFVPTQGARRLVVAWLPEGVFETPETLLGNFANSPAHGATTTHADPQAPRGGANEINHQWRGVVHDGTFTLLFSFRAGNAARLFTTPTTAHRIAWGIAGSISDAVRVGPRRSTASLGAAPDTVRAFLGRTDSPDTHGLVIVRA